LNSALWCLSEALPNPYEVSLVKGKYYSIKAAGWAAPFHFHPLGRKQGPPHLMPQPLGDRKNREGIDVCERR